MKTTEQMLQIGRNSRTRAKSSRTITRATAAKMFKVPIGTIRKLWPNLPFCTPTLVLYKHSDSRQPSAADTAPAVQISIDPADILTREELARHLKVPLGWIKEKTRRRNRNKLPSHSMGRFTRFIWPEVCQWIRDGENK